MTTDTNTTETDAENRIDTAHHVVCHDCEAESVLDDGDLAHDVADWHADLKGHNVEIAEVSR